MTPCAINCTNNNDRKVLNMCRHWPESRVIHQPRHDHQQQSPVPTYPGHNMIPALTLSRPGPRLSLLMVFMQIMPGGRLR